jgi:hypothetical protein
MSDPQDPLARVELRIVQYGLRCLGIASFLVFLLWALDHLWKLVP